MNFFFQAEDGIRDRNVTGVQTCALPILWRWRLWALFIRGTRVVRCRRPILFIIPVAVITLPSRCIKCGQIGRASCRERVYISVGGGSGKEKNKVNDYWSGVI